MILYVGLINDVVKVKNIFFQVMVFVHARNATVKTALNMRERANNEGDINFFLCDKNAQFGAMEKKVWICLKRYKGGQISVFN